MTRRLYYTDPYRESFEATVERVERSGDRLIVSLDQTAFYPTSGGQPFDTGVLGGFRVIDVIENEEDGSIAHMLDGTKDQEASADQGPRPLHQGQVVHGTIDWPRRFEHMQQHTGQHVLSAAFDKLFGVRTVSFHLGADVSTIDLARELAASDIAAAEEAANRIVWEDRPVAIRFASADEAARLPLRKEPVRGGTLRLIDIEGWDLSACGGTHVARTGAIGIVAVGSWERFKGGQRLEVLCGVRALRRFRVLRDALAASTKLLSVGADTVPVSIERLQADVKEQKRQIAASAAELARFRATELARSAEPARFGRLVLRALDADANGLKSLAAAVTADPGYATVLVSTGRRALLVVARSADVSLSAQEVVAALTAKFGGRGGGKPELAQAGGLDGGAEEILAAARELISSVASRQT